MTPPEVLLIRADAGPQIGTGHVMRCLALAQAWQEAGGQAVFALTQAPDGVEARLRSEGLTLARIAASAGSAADAQETLALARKAGATRMALDGYHFPEGFFRTIRAAGIALLLVDDTGGADRKSPDWILNQNLSAGAADYPGREKQTRLLLGTRYALLRREFRSSNGRARTIPPVARKILVTLGGGDPDNATLTVLQALRRLSRRDLEIRIVIGPANPHGERLRREAQGEDSIELLTAVTDMRALMAWTDLAVSAGGSTCWELAFMGVPMVTVVLAENQRRIAQSLDEAGAAESAGWHAGLSAEALAQRIERLLLSQETRKRMSERGRELVDGLGAQRVVEVLAAPPGEASSRG